MYTYIHSCMHTCTQAQLGDGRAISLGEVVGVNGTIWELQLKGAGMYMCEYVFVCMPSRMYLYMYTMHACMHVCVCVCVYGTIWELQLKGAGEGNRAQM